MPELIALAVLAFVEITDTLNDQDTLMTRLSEQKDKGFLGWLSTVIRLAMEAIALVEKLTLSAFVDDGKGFAKESREKFADVLEKTGIISKETRGKYQGFLDNKTAEDNLNTVTSPLGGFTKGLAYEKTMMNPFASQEDKTKAWADYYMPRGGKMGEYQNSGSVTITSPITINVANGDPITIENTMNDVMGKWATKASANTSTFSLLKQ
jgi:hypothetical protein